MYYPGLQEDNNTRTMIDTWLGYNHNYRTRDGEFYDMENLSSDQFPIMAPRKKRVPVRKTEGSYRGFLYVGDTFAYLEGDVFHYSTWELDLSQFLEDSEKGKDDEQTLVLFGTYVLIYPLNIYINIAGSMHLTDAGRMTHKYTAEQGITLTYSMCDIDGNDYENVTVSDTAPEDPVDGAYWLCTKEYSEGLNMWVENTHAWTPVATTYIRIHIPGANLKSLFKVDDVVEFNTDRLWDYKDGSQIKAISDEYFVIIGLMNVASQTQSTTEAWTLTVQQVIPSLDYVCTDKNRVWGCKYGYDKNGKFVNEIYCTKLGDFSSWYTYQGLSTDSYAVTIGTPGAWTGCISYGGYPTFFKENRIIRIFGTQPSNYTVDEINARGVQYGSHKSLAIVNETLFYKAPGGVMAFDGSLPAMVSSQFGRDITYSNGVAGALDNKYYIVMLTPRGGSVWFVYDTEYGIWTKENSMPVQFFSGSVNGAMYACTSDTVYAIGREDILDSTGLIGEEYVEWFAETGDLGFEYPDFKFVSKLTLRAYVPAASEIQVQISYDDCPYEDVGILRGQQEIMTQTLYIFPFRCDHYRIRIKGHGNVRIYTLATTLETGSDDYEYKN